MAEENEIELFVGRLGEKPDLRYTQKQEPVCTLSVAQNIDGSEKAIWRKIIVFGKQAEHCNLYLKKGSSVFVQGRKSVREYINKQGEKRTINELKAKLVGFAL